MTMATMQRAGTSRDTADNLIHVTERLASLMKQEVALLRGNRARDIMALQGDKESLAAVYQRMMQDLQADPGLLDGLEEDRRTAMLQAAHSLEAAAADNAIALHSALQANQRLMQAIADAVRDQRSENLPYARNGRISSGALAGACTPTASLALNQTL
jgi:uncharacterized protein (DUF885 family)